MVAGETFRRFASGSTETLPARSSSWRIFCARRSVDEGSSFKGGSEGLPPCGSASYAYSSSHAKAAKIF